MELTNEHDQRLDLFDVSGPGRQVHVAVGQPGRRSGVWIWANKRKTGVSRWNRPVRGRGGDAVGGVAFATATDLINTRTVGVLTLGTIAVALGWLGVVLWRERH